MLLEQNFLPQYILNIDAINDSQCQSMARLKEPLFPTYFDPRGRLLLGTSITRIQMYQPDGFRVSIRAHRRSIL